jgi:alpha-glucosidase
MPEEAEWWKRAVVYQVYPRSFQDSNGDGVGDLSGMRERLGYLSWLGVDAIWLSPIYPSPMADFGYDISDYTGIDPIFGTLHDFDLLLAEVHRLGLKVILDFVPNHTSDQHPWFAQSRSSPESVYRDWYLWRDPQPGGGPPNNWQSAFGGSAWEFDEASGQYYYHAFLPQQPDLNWRNPAVQEAMWEVLRFWLGRGVDGFRVDVIWHLVKDANLRDNPRSVGSDQSQPEEFTPIYNTDRPEIHDLIAKMRSVVDEFPDRVLIGEIYLPVERLIRYYGERGRGLHLPFNFQLLVLTWEADRISTAVQRYESLLPTHGWPNWVLGNHDWPRVATRVGEAQARVAAMLLLTLRGTPTLYYGDEIAMVDVPIPPDATQDPVAARLGSEHGRDPARTPMQWDASKNAGFTRASPWLPIGLDHTERNVAAQVQDERSMLTLVRRLLSLRKARSGLQIGDYAMVNAPPDVLAFTRSEARESLLVGLNFGNQDSQLALPEGWAAANVLLSTHLDRTGPVQGPVALRANEGIILGVPG